MACIARNLALLALAGLAVVEDGKKEASEFAFFAAAHLAAIYENLQRIRAEEYCIVGQVWGHKDSKESFVLKVDYNLCRSAECGESETVVFYDLVALSHPAEIPFAHARGEQRVFGRLLQELWRWGKKKVNSK